MVNCDFFAVAITVATATEKVAVKIAVIATSYIMPISYHYKIAFIAVIDTSCILPISYHNKI